MRGRAHCVHMTDAMMTSRKTKQRVAEKKMKWATKLRNSIHTPLKASLQGRWSIRIHTQRGTRGERKSSQHRTVDGSFIRPGKHHHHRQTYTVSKYQNSASIMAKGVQVRGKTVLPCHYSSLLLFPLFMHESTLPQMQRLRCQPTPTPHYFPCRTRMWRQRARFGW